MKGFLVVIALMVVVGCGALVAMSMRGGDEGASPDTIRRASPKPEPTLTTSELRSKRVGKFRYRVHPRSEDVPNEGIYRFHAPHCGLDWMIDFDASFWQIVDRRSYGESGPSFFINSDRGTMKFLSNDDVTYEASTGEEVPLRRLPGRIVIELCA